MPKDNRPFEYRISLSREEYEIVENRREKAGLNKAKFGRQALMIGEIIGSIPTQETKEMLAELRRVGNLLNQIARAYNIGKMATLTKETVKETIEELEEVLAEIYNQS